MNTPDGGEDRDLRDLSLPELARSEEASRVVARLLGLDNATQPPRVARFQSYIDSREPRS